MMKMTERVVSELLAHARTQAPIEACGYLVAKNSIAVDSIRLTNVDNSPEHFSLDPAEQFAAVRRIRKGGMRLCGVYHSHPASPARPSQEDIRLALDPTLSYVIVSLATPEPEIRSFTIRSGVVTSEEIEFVPSAEEATHVL